MPSRSQRDTDLKLIKLVRENELLYNARHPKYLETEEKLLTWKKIGEELDKPASFCRSRWISLRDQMKRKFRQRMKNRTLRKYKYHNELSFIVPHFKAMRQRKGSHLEGDDNSAESDYEIPAEVYVESDIKFDDDDSSGMKLIGMGEANTSYDEVTFNDYKDTSAKEPNMTDPLDVFLMSIGATMRGFTPYYINQAKTKIFQIVQDVELQQILDKKGKGSSNINKNTDGR